MHKAENGKRMKDLSLLFSTKLEGWLAQPCRLPREFDPERKV